MTKKYLIIIIMNSTLPLYSMNQEPYTLNVVYNELCTIQRQLNDLVNAMAHTEQSINALHNNSEYMDPTEAATTLHTLKQHSQNEYDQLAIIKGKLEEKIHIIKAAHDLINILKH